MNDIKKNIEAAVASRIGNKYNEALDYANKQLNGKTVLTAANFNDISRNIPYNKFSLKDYIDIVDDIPLKKKDYDEAVEYLSTLIKQYNSKANDAYRKASNQTERAFKDVLRRDSFTYNGPNADKVFDIIYSKAYENGHASGYYEIKSEFDDLDDFVDDIIKLIR